MQPIAGDARLRDVTLHQTLTLVDATLIQALPRMMAASLFKSQTGSGLVKWRLHSHFEVDRYVPVRIDVTRDDLSALFVLDARPVKWLTPARWWLTAFRRR